MFNLKWVWFVDWGRLTFHYMYVGAGEMSIVGVLMPTLGMTLNAVV